MKTRGAVRRALTQAAVVVAVALCCVAPLDVRALPPGDVDAAETAAVAPSAEIGEDEASELHTLAQIEADIISDAMRTVLGIFGTIVAAFVGWQWYSLRADRRRTDDTMKADRAQVQKMTTELIASLREQAQIYKEADQANREGLAQVVKSIGRVDDDVRALRRDLGQIDERVTVLESASAASTIRGRRTTKDTP